MKLKCLQGQGFISHIKKFGLEADGDLDSRALNLRLEQQHEHGSLFHAQHHPDLCNQNCLCKKILR